MGTWFAFTCPGCGYRAEASGGRDIGMLAVVQTSTCGSCRELVDVVIGYYGQDGPTGDPEQDRELGRCPDCGSAAVIPWPERQPCPKCGNAMEQGGLIALWD